MRLISSQMYSGYHSPKELNAQKYSRNRHPKDIARRIEKAERSSNKTATPPSVEEQIISSRKRKNDHSSCYRSRVDRINQDNRHRRFLNSFVKQTVSQALDDLIPIEEETDWRAVFKDIAKEAAHRSPLATKERAERREIKIIEHNREQFRPLFKKMAVQAGYLTWRWKQSL